MLMSIGDLVADMQKEDPGVTASVFSQGESDDIPDADQAVARRSGSAGCGRRRAAASYLRDTLMQLSLCVTGSGILKKLPISGKNLMSWEMKSDTICEGSTPLH